MSAWFVFERWTFNRHSGKKWLMDVLGEIQARTASSPPIDWVASVPPRHIRRAATWSEENWKRASQQLLRVSTFVGDSVITRARHGSPSSLNVDANLENGNLRDEVAQIHIPMVSSPIPQSPPRSPFSSMPTLPQLTEEPETIASRGNRAEASMSTPSIATTLSDCAAAASSSDTHSAEMSDHSTQGAAKRRLADLVRNVMRVRQSTAGPLSPSRKRTTSSTAFTDGARSMSDNTVTSMRVSRVANLIPALKSMAPVHFMQPHTALVRHLQFSPGGEFLASCSWDRTCAIFRVKDFTMPPRVLAHPQGFVGQVAWSPKGDLLLTKMVRGMKLWTTEVNALSSQWLLYRTNYLKSGVCRKTIDRKCAVQSVAWYPQGDG